MFVLPARTCRAGSVCGQHLGRERGYLPPKENPPDAGAGAPNPPNEGAAAGAGVPKAALPAGAPNPNKHQLSQIAPFLSALHAPNPVAGAAGCPNAGAAKQSPKRRQYRLFPTKQQTTHPAGPRIHRHRQRVLPPAAEAAAVRILQKCCCSRQTCCFLSPTLPRGAVRWREKDSE